MNDTSPSQSEQRLRHAVIVVAALSIGGVATELALIGHWGSGSQMVPWVVLGAEAAAVAFMVNPAGRSTLTGVRVFAVVVVVAAWWGAIEHLSANAEFLQELHPDWSRSRIVWAATRGGVPLLAPLSVSLPALLAAVATVHHPLARVTRSVGLRPPML